MRNSTSLGEAKTFVCANCNGTFPKRRYDQNCCSKNCALKYHATKRPPWITRPDRDKQNAQKLQRYYAKHEENKHKAREYRIKNIEKIRESSRKHYTNNKEKRILQTNAYRKQHPEIRHKEYQNARQKHPWGFCLTNAKNRADKKGFAFDLTREWCEQRWTGNCEITGLPFVFGTQLHFPFAPSIDRIKSDLGYTKDNCRFVLFAVNSLKGTGTDEQMLQIAQAIVARYTT